MKRSSSILKLPLASLSLFGAHMLSAQIIQVNFGTDPNITGWNNIPAFSAIDEALSLVDSAGNPTSVDFILTSGFNSTNSSGSGVDVGDFPAAVTGNSLFGNTAPFGNGSVSAPNPSFELDGLDANQTYDIQIFASRMSASDNREAQYTIDGLGTSTGYLNASNNSSEILAFYGIAPSNSGMLSISIEASENNTNSFEFIYMGGMILSENSLTAIPEPNTFSLIVTITSIALMTIRRRRC